MPLWYHLYRRQYGWPPPLFMLDIQRGPDNESLCKVWWRFYCRLFFKQTFNFRLQICKFSTTLAPPIWTGWLVTPLFYFGFPKGILQVYIYILYAKFHGIFIVGYILNEFKYILRFRCHCQLVEYPTMHIKHLICKRPTSTLSYKNKNWKNAPAGYGLKWWYLI